jgi:phage-related holin
VYLSLKLLIVYYFSKALTGHLSVSISPELHFKNNFLFSVDLVENLHIYPMVMINPQIICLINRLELHVAKIVFYYINLLNH